MASRKNHMEGQDMGIDYKDAGVDVEAGYEAVRQMKEYVDRKSVV